MPVCIDECFLSFFLFIERKKKFVAPKKMNSGATKKDTVKKNEAKNTKRQTAAEFQSSKHKASTGVCILF